MRGVRQVPRPTRLARSLVHRGPWFSFYLDTVRFPGGRVVEQHHVLEFSQDAVAVVVVRGRGELLLVQSYRYVIDAIQWEVPAGTLNPGESVLAAARREVREESGCETRDHELLYTYYPMNGIADKVFHVVRCRAASDTGTFDRNEIAAVRWHTGAHVQAMIQRGTIKDGFSLTALLLHWQAPRRLPRPRPKA